MTMASPSSAALIAMLAASLGACTIPIVPTERMPITWARTGGGHGHYEKGGVDLSGLTCGEQYQRAVAGVPEAEDAMRGCERSTKAYGWLMTGFIVLPAASLGVGLAVDGPARGDVIATGIALGVVSFAVGVIMGVRGRYQLGDAVHLYDRALSR